MKEMKCIHPRKVIKFMLAFANAVCETGDILYYNGEEILNPDDDILEWEFGDAIFYPCEVTFKKSNRFAYCVRDDNADPEVIIFYNFEELFCKGSKEFRQDFTRRCPAAKGFADVTIAILHELGHAATNFDDDLANFNRSAALDELETKWMATHKKGERGFNFEYFKMPDETAATDWAIKWLQNPEHRKIAKAFEKQFFSCFAAK